MAHILSLATSLPEHRFSQQELHDVAQAVLPDTPESASVLGIFRNAAIDQRYLARPVEWYLEPHGHQERAAVYAEVGLELMVRAAEDALERAGVAPADLGGVMLVSTTGWAAPSLDARLVDRLGWPSHIRRLPVWGLGCAGGVAGLNRAAEWSHALDAPVLLLCLELCSINLELGDALTGGALDKKAIVATALFGDGCAAAVVGPGEGPEVVGGASHLFADTPWVMGWDVTDRNMEVVLSPKIPDIVREHAAPVVTAFLQAHGVARPDAWILHPGGAKVIDAHQDALGLSDEERRWTDGVLRRYGNMSSPTVLFELRDHLDADASPGRTLLLSALGPGFASELCLVRT